jgi:hypothetical protein
MTGELDVIVTAEYGSREPAAPWPAAPEPAGLAPAVIVDVDGTLADVAGIRHYVTADGEHRGRNFTAFHAASSWVDPHAEVVRVVQALDARGLAIVVLTSRSERWRYRTSSWLTKWRVPVTALGMRSDSDSRPDHEVKRDLHGRMLALGYAPVLAIDDNPGVIALWVSLGIPTVRVPGWPEEPGGPVGAA